MIRRRTVLADLSGTALDVLSARTTIDEGTVPWITAELEVGRPTDLSILDPATSPARVLSVTSAALPGDVDPVALSEQVLLDSAESTSEDTVRLVGKSHDQRLIDYHPTATDRTALGLQGSARSIIGHVLDRVYGSWGWTTAPGMGVNAPDVAYRAYDELTNLIPNGGFEGGTGGWTGVQAAVAQSSVWKNTGVYSLVVTPNGNSVASYGECAVSLEPDTVYTVAGLLRIFSVLSGSLSSYSRRIVVTGTVGGAVGTVIAQTDAVPNTANASRLMRKTFRTPINGTDFTVRVYNGQSGSNSNGVYADDIFLVEGDGTEADGSPVATFDGNTPSTSTYTYAWTDAANSSPSVRVPVLDRPSDSLVWDPATSAFDFLAPILQSLGWRMPPGKIVAGTFMFYLVTNRWQGRTGALTNASYGDSLYAVSSSRSRSDTFPDGVPMYADAVILVYRWTDFRDREQVRVDAYAPVGYSLPFVQEYPTAWPGPGRAQALWRRFQARARRVPVTVPLSSSVQAGGPIVVSSPQSGTILATIDSMTTDYLDGRIDVTTKGAVDYPSNAWIAATDTWNTAPTGSWDTDI